MLFLALYCTPRLASAGPGDAPATTQRQINGMAAALERARMALIEDTGLRQPQEPLSAYLDRIAAPQPGEAVTAYNVRLQGYLKAIEQAATATAPGRRVPPLRHADPANRQIWQRAAEALTRLPLSLQQARDAWKSVVSEETRNSARTAPLHRLGAELNRSLAQILTAFGALRDARP
jgi:hypothetical protein